MQSARTRMITSLPMLTWSCTEWSSLARDDLYDALTLRQTVFVVEQTCAYLDCDGRDRQAFHLFGRKPEHAAPLLAYARILPPGVAYDEVSIGRVVTHPCARHEGYGRALVEEALRHVDAIFGPTPIRIGAQQYLERFYRDFGFLVIGDAYLEDGIPHLPMLRPGARSRA